MPFSWAVAQMQANKPGLKPYLAYMQKHSRLPASAGSDTCSAKILRLRLKYPLPILSETLLIMVFRLSHFSDILLLPFLNSICCLRTNTIILIANILSLLQTVV